MGVFMAVVFNVRLLALAPIFSLLIFDTIQNVIKHYCRTDFPQILHFCKGIRQIVNEKGMLLLVVTMMTEPSKEES